MSLSDLTYASLEQAINQHISVDPKARSEMAKLHGRVVGIQVMGTGQTLYLAPGPEMIQLFATHEGEPDCLLQGSPMTIAQLRTQIPEAGPTIPEDMQVSGDIELAEQFCRILRSVNIDWEEYLAQYTGTLIAGEVGKAINFAGYWRDHIADTFRQDVHTVLQHENSVLLSREDITRFSSEVDQLAQQLEQLQLRISKLKNNNSK
jgi:ubiquinone biosynthesis protein UbiJ